MSAYVVDRAHVHALVRVAIAGPSDGEHRPGFGPFPLRWYCADPGHPHGGYVRTVVTHDDLAQGPGSVTPSQLGELLWTENVRSVMHRYPDTLDGEGLPGTGDQWREAYAYEDPRYRLTIAEAGAAVRGLRYQSCEHPEWEASQAAAALTNLERSLLAVVPGTQDAPWEWSAGQLEERRAGIR